MSRSRPGHAIQRHGEYRLASADEKRRLTLARWRSLSLVHCPACSAGIPSDQLAGHAGRCEGSREALHAAITRRPV